jgi:hypothetical protein
MSKFSDLHQDMYVEDDPAQTAERIVNALRLSSLQADILGTLIGDYCQQYERGRVRNVEAQATRSGKRVDPTGERRQLLDESFAVGDGRRVKWGEATVADHRARIEMLTKLRDGIDATLVRHMDAISQLEQAHARCLNDIYKSKVVAA